MRAEQSRNALIDYLSTGVAESWAFEDLLLLGKRRSEITGKISHGQLPNVGKRSSAAIRRTLSGQSRRRCQLCRRLAVCSGNGDSGRLVGNGEVMIFLNLNSVTRHNSGRGTALLHRWFVGRKVYSVYQNKVQQDLLSGLHHFTCDSC